MKINKTKLYSYPNKNMKDNSSPNNKSNTIQDQISNPLINHINFDSLFIFDHNEIIFDISILYRIKIELNFPPSNYYF